MEPLNRHGDRIVKQCAGPIRPRPTVEPQRLASKVEAPRPASIDLTRRNTVMSGPKQAAPQQLLHLVFGGELEKLDSTRFRDLDKLDIVGIYPKYAEAYSAWKAAAQKTVDNAQMRYFIVHMHRLLDPSLTEAIASRKT
jgi:hypothetical protein